MGGGTVCEIPWDLVVNEVMESPFTLTRKINLWEGNL